MIPPPNAAAMQAALAMDPRAMPSAPKAARPQPSRLGYDKVSVELLNAFEWPAGKVRRWPVLDGLNDIDEDEAHKPKPRAERPAETPETPAADVGGAFGALSAEFGGGF